MRADFENDFCAGLPYIKSSSSKVHSEQKEEHL